jgi:hypothetical protein
MPSGSGVMDGEAILAEVSPIRSMREALAWAQARSPRAVFVNAVTQDEFTIDVVIAIGGGLHVVFDTT